MWNNFESKEFMFQDRIATIVYPSVKPNGKMILKPEYLPAFPTFDIAMLERGYYLINIQHYSRWAPDEETHIMADFVRFCAKELGADEKCIVEGMSCGGLQGARFAQEYPELCAVLYLDNPVLNMLSMYGCGACKDDMVSAFRTEITNTYGVDESTILNFRNSPIDYLDKLIDNKIPVLLIYGNGDPVVIFRENGNVLKEYYETNGGDIKVIVRSMQKHHPHGLDNPTPIIEFVEKYV
jgi:pimeloyl-ACP methyl ester carboxylesterase